MSGQHRLYRRLNVFVVARSSAKKRAERVAEQLSEIMLKKLPIEPSDPVLEEAASLLRQLASPTSSVGRPPACQRRADVALDYLAHRLLYGRGKYMSARHAVADAWCMSEKNVESCWADYQSSANYQLETLKKRHLCQFTDEADFLRALSADLREINEITADS